MTKQASTNGRDLLDHWSDYESEVSHYFTHEEGVPSCGFETGGSRATEPKPPRFPAGADYWTMWTVIDRLRAADRVMPFRGDAYDRRPRGLGESGANPEQVHRGGGQPSASMVLRAAYGTKSCRYDDQAPDGAKLLRRARRAYVRAAQEVAARKRPSAMDRLMARFDRAFGVGQ